VESEGRWRKKKGMTEAEAGLGGTAEAEEGE
jgi:hypothetical protein